MQFVQRAQIHARAAVDLVVAVHARLAEEAVGHRPQVPVAGKEVAAAVLVADVGDPLDARQEQLAEELGGEEGPFIRREVAAAPEVTEAAGGEEGRWAVAGVSRSKFSKIWSARKTVSESGSPAPRKSGSRREATIRLSRAE